jgi:hypothetical protein
MDNAVRTITAPARLLITGMVERIAERLRPAVPTRRGEPPGPDTGF